MTHRFENHDLQTESCGQFIDITDDVLATVERSGVRDGQVVVFSPHTTCAVVIQEHETGFMEDFLDLMEELAPREARYYRHDDLTVRTEGIEEDTGDFPNGHSHVRSALLSSTSQTLSIVGDVADGSAERRCGWRFGRSPRSSSVRESGGRHS